MSSTVVIALTQKQKTRIQAIQKDLATAKEALATQRCLVDNHECDLEEHLSAVFEDKYSDDSPEDYVIELDESGEYVIVREAE